MGRGFGHVLKTPFAAAVICAFLVFLSTPLTASQQFIQPGLHSTTATHASHSPISIDGDDSFTIANGVTGGTGSATDPYIIEGWDIDASDSDGIYVNGTVAHFIIRDVDVHSSKYFYADTDAIRIENATNGDIFNCSATGAVHGITVSSSSNITLKNSTAEWNQYEIRIQSCTDLVVDNNEIGTNGSSYIECTALSIVSNSAIGVNSPYGARTALYFWRCDNVSISDNELRYIMDGAIEALDCQMVAMTGNTVDTNYRGLSFTGCSHLTLSDNELQGSAGRTSVIRCDHITLDSNLFAMTGDVQFVDCSNGSIMGNNFSYSGEDDDVRLQNCQDFEIENNWMLSSPNYGLFNGAGVWMRDSVRIAVNHNSISSDGLNGLTMISCRNCSAAGNSFTNGGALILGNTTDDFSSNDITDSNSVNGKTLIYAKYKNGTKYDGPDWGQIIAFSCKNLTIANLSLERIVVGIEVAFTDGLTISQCSISQSRYGMIAHECSDATVVGNTFDFNQIGISLNHSSNFLIYHNNITGNLMDEVDLDGSDNSWDDGYPSGGNYWGPYADLVDKFNGPNQDQEGSDGIGDTSFGPDRYPLMNPFGTQEKGSESLFWAAVLAVIVVVVIVALIMLIWRRGKAHGAVASGEDPNRDGPEDS